MRCYLKNKLKAKKGLAIAQVKSAFLASLRPCVQSPVPEKTIAKCQFMQEAKVLDSADHRVSSMSSHQVL
jgi:hypothetical protein